MMTHPVQWCIYVVLVGDESFQSSKWDRKGLPQYLHNKSWPNDKDVRQGQKLLHTTHHIMLVIIWVYAEL